MTTDKMRAEFEGWLAPGLSSFRVIDSEGDEVCEDDWVQGAWIGWKASRATLVVELPRPDTSLSNGRSDAACEALLEQWRSDQAAIEAAGVKVKP